MKSDGSLCVCLDSQKLNKALKRSPHKIPTVEEITPAFSKAKYFTKLDAKAGYWNVKLAPSSQELTTFRIPFGSAIISPSAEKLRNNTMKESLTSSRWPEKKDRCQTHRSALSRQTACLSLEEYTRTKYSSLIQRRSRTFSRCQRHRAMRTYRNAFVC